MSDQAKATAVGSVTLEVQHLGGITERVQVRQLPVRDMDAFFETMGNAARRAELLCGRPDQWANDLTAESVLEVLRKGDEVNKGFFALLDYRLDIQRKILAAAKGSD